VLKHFFKWMRNCEDGSPPEVRGIRKGKAPASRFPILPKDLFTADEKVLLIRSATNLRDRALIEVASESGRRIGELLTLHTGDVEFDGIGAKLFVNGKVGHDFARIISSSPALAIWLDNHPLRDDPDAPVWVGFGKSNKMKQLSQTAATAMLKKTARRAGIRKRRIHFYLFRHTRIDETQGLLTEAQQCMMFGWRFGSRMPAVYFKRYGKHIDDAQTIMNGVIPPKRESIQAAQPRTCMRCKMQNSQVAKFCNRCGGPFDLVMTAKVDEAKKAAEELLDEITADPAKIQKLRSLLSG
jgi:integrase/recombinase XerD